MPDDLAKKQQQVTTLSLRYTRADWRTVELKSFE